RLPALAAPSPYTPLFRAGAPAAEVAAAFENALSKAHGQSLRQDCYWRLVLTLERAGELERAKLRAQDSLREYPNGRYAPELLRRDRKSTRLNSSHVKISY